MDKRYQHLIDGQEVSQADVNLLGRVAAEAGDRRLADTLEIRESYGLSSPVTPQKVIMPWQARQSGSTPYHSLVRPSGTGDGGVFVSPFRAVLGGTTPNSGPSEDRILGVKSGYHFPADGSDVTNLRLDATVSNNRIDLIYAQVNVASASSPVTRYVKGPTGTVSAQSVSQYTEVTVSLGVIKGNEGASPAKPPVPSDTADVAYFIPIAYVWLAHPFTTSTTIVDRQIEEVATVVGQNHGRTGGANAGPAGEVCREGSSLLASDPWSVTSRPMIWMAPSMTGVVCRFFGLNQRDAPESVPVSTIRTLDSTIDWRKRLFWTRVSALSTADGMCWEAENKSGAIFPKADAVTGDHIDTFGQSFQEDSSSDRGLVVYATGVQLPPLDDVLRVYVDLNSGQLKIETPATKLNCYLFFWIWATGRMEIGGDPSYL